MTKPVAFKCPHGKHTAYYYGSYIAGCPYHGRLLYTDIPQELTNKKNFRLVWVKIIKDNMQGVIRHANAKVREYLKSK